MLNLKNKRIRRSLKTRIKIADLGAIRLSVHRTNLHIYAQLINDRDNIVIACASTLEPDVRKSLTKGGNVAAAAFIGKRIAEKNPNINDMDVSRAFKLGRCSDEVFTAIAKYYNTKASKMAGVLK